MKFPYRKLPLIEPSAFFGAKIIKPIISIKVRYGTRDVDYFTLIDSGADFCIFDAEIGEAVGIAIERGEQIEFGGIQARTGSIGYLHDITISVGGLTYETRVAFSREIAEHGFGILGQKGFFDIFSITFDYQKEEIILKEKRK
ncbi:MAG: hypothetical protein HY567_04020 [Candidatus Kerfeldbacteria bacterium]|nr:hypothetical protein [Candidatus Kerfeldbacteria bacterium]